MDRLGSRRELQQAPRQTLHSLSEAERAEFCDQIGQHIREFNMPPLPRTSLKQRVINTIIGLSLTGGVLVVSYFLCGFIGAQHLQSNTDLSKCQLSTNPAGETIHRCSSNAYEQAWLFNNMVLWGTLMCCATLALFKLRNGLHDRLTRLCGTNAEQQHQQWLVKGREAVTAMAHNCNDLCTELLIGQAGQSTNICTAKVKAKVERSYPVDHDS